MPILSPLWRPTFGRCAAGFGIWRKRIAPEPERSSRLLLLCCIAMGAFIATNALAAERITPLQEVLRDKDGNFVPDRLGETFTVSGILISDPIDQKGYGPDGSEYASLVNLQDNTGGILLFTRNTGLLHGGFKRGVAVEARGKLSQQNGTEELMLMEIRMVGAEAVPNPRDVLAADLKSERYSGRLVRVAGELIAPPDLLESKRGIVLRDRS